MLVIKLDFIYEYTEIFQVGNLYLMFSFPGEYKTVLSSEQIMCRLVFVRRLPSFTPAFGCANTV